MKALGLLVVLVAGTLSGCGIVDPGVCTRIGCRAGLTVELQAAPQGPFTLTAAADGVVRTIQCADPALCPLFFEDLVADQVTLTYRSGEVTVEETFSPDYVLSRPNGDDCPPVCENATVVLAIGP